MMREQKLRSAVTVDIISSKREAAIDLVRRSTDSRIKLVVFLREFD